MASIRALSWGLALACLPSLSRAVPAVDVDMVAAFPSPPFLTELMETAAQENASTYFHLLDRIATGYFGQASTDQDVYEAFVTLLQEDDLIGSAEGLSSFQYAMSLRTAAPRVEAHFQFYQTAVAGESATTSDCLHWILWAGNKYCTPSLDEPTAAVAEHAAQLETLPFDRKLGDGPDAILYTDISAAGFGPFHTFLAGKARQRQLTYRVRHVRPEEERAPLPVSGYGVELALKRTDYIVIDDREKDEETAADKKEKTASDPAEMVLDTTDEVEDLRALSKSEVASLGLKAAEYIVQSADPLAALVHVTEDFPKHSGALAQRGNVSSAFLGEHRANRRQLVPAGTNVVWLNGVQLWERQVQAHAIVEVMRQERARLAALADLGLTAAEAVDVLSHEAVTKAQTAGGPASPQRFDWRDEAEGGDVIVWLNNIEADPQYADFTPQLRGLLQGGAPGQIPAVRRNMFHQIFAVDLARTADVALVVEQLFGFVQRRLPIRFGIVPLATEPAAADQAKVVYHLLATYGMPAVLAYLDEILAAATTAEVTVDAAAFAAVMAGHEGVLREGATVLTLDAVLAADEYETRAQHARQWAARLGANAAVRPIFVDGVVVPRDEQWMQGMGSRLGLHLRSLQEAVYYGTVTETMWAGEHFLRGAAAKRSAYVFPADGQRATVLDVGMLEQVMLEQVPVIEADDEAAQDAWAVLTVVADLGSAAGVQLLWAALQFRAQQPGVRLEVVHNGPGDYDTTVFAHVDALLEAAAASVDDLATLIATDEAASADYLAALAEFQAATAIAAGTSVVLLNGRVVGPIAADATDLVDTLTDLLAYEQAARITPVLAALTDLGLAERVGSALDLARLTSLVARSTEVEGVVEGQTVRTAAFRVFETAHTSFVAGAASAPTLQFTAVLDPASETAQRWAPLLAVLARLAGVQLQVWMNPREHLDALPVRRFYRAAVQLAPAFGTDGRVAAVHARFGGLPSAALLNLGMDVPAAWLVAPRTSVYDLDNIRLGAVKTGGDVAATYGLEHILIEGHTREAGSQQPPRGAQLVLETAAGTKIADTIVMANLGYFQFQANPGFYHIRLKPGRSAAIFAIDSLGPQGIAAVPGDEGSAVALLGFGGATLYPQLSRRPGQAGEDVLDAGPAAAATAATGMAGLVSKGRKLAEELLGRTDHATDSATDNTALEPQADINIFSIASGHLYERMLNIMMVSVMTHTQHTVKFWFIEQFLSPSFKELLPALAAAYGFRYELVTYKWPHWLRAQTEKQREIWGYKILFLDVLFPLALDKVIFVDADQIVRTDLYELVQLDLGGAPYGFTPMCDSRTEMDGFRFWRQGYWKTYLRGAPYHISALYVVDLRRFRALAAGDRLRQTYHSLSADPNSLANLDQDLPNHLQFQIPIFSLPQDWLWCETWCSDAALATAKTIDLCNNPETKEPKLDRARRQVPEWTVYDDAVAAVAAVARRRRGQGVPVQWASEAASEAEAKETTRTTETNDPETEKHDEL